MQDFTSFLQIILWLLMPILLLSVLVTVLLHYYQHRRSKKKESDYTSGEITNHSQQARYRALKKDFDMLQQLNQANEEELSFLSAEMKRQDQVIDQLRSEVVSLKRFL